MIVRLDKEQPDINRTDDSVEDERYQLWWDGLIFVKGIPSGAPSVRNFLHELRSKELTHACCSLSGTFACLVLDKLSGNYYAFADNRSNTNLFYSEKMINTSFLDMLPYVHPRLSQLKMPTIVEFILTGRVFFPNVFFDSIRSLQHNEIVVIKAGKQRVIEKHLPDLLSEKLHQRSFVKAFEDIVKSVKNRQLSIDLSGGTDSRLTVLLFREEVKQICKDGSIIYTELKLSILRNTDGRPTGILGVMRDITPERETEEKRRFLAYHDGLTGLPNRILFNDRLSVALAHAQRNHQNLCVLSLNLDRFKEVNERSGYIVANKLLQEVALRLTSLLRKGDTVARLAGDQFALLLPSLVRLEHADTVARKILEALRKPVECEGYSINITASIGVAIYPEDGQSAEALIKNANATMCRAKEQGRDNYQRFNRSTNSPDPGLSADDI